jgi:uncharacterized protein YoxC
LSSFKDYLSERHKDIWQEIEGKNRLIASLTAEIHMLDKTRILIEDIQDKYDKRKEEE